MSVTTARKIVLTFLLGCWSMTITQPSQASPSSELQRKMLLLQPKMKPSVIRNLSDALLQLDEGDRDLALAIAFQECSLRPTTRVCLRSKDKGLFQFSPATIKQLGMNTRYLNGRNLKYEVRYYKKWMAVKRLNCESRYPVTWFACWNSATKKHHYRYATYLFKHLNKIKGER